MGINITRLDSSRLPEIQYDDFEESLHILDKEFHAAINGVTRPVPYADTKFWWRSASPIERLPKRHVRISRPVHLLPGADDQAAQTISTILDLPQERLADRDADGVSALLTRHAELEETLGLPVTDVEHAIASPMGTQGYYQRFERGSLYWCQSYGPRTTYGEIGRRYDEMGGSAGALGFPTTDEEDTDFSPQGTIGRLQRFEQGVLYWTDKTGPRLVRGPIGLSHAARDGERGILGFAVTDEAIAFPSSVGTTGLFQRFEGPKEYPPDLKDHLASVRCGATIYWSEQHGAYATWGVIGVLYERVGGTEGLLGFPTSSVSEVSGASTDFRSDTVYVQGFESGEILLPTGGIAPYIKMSYPRYDASTRGHLRRLLPHRHS